jgi:DEAD/DEAH box helicase domain-containing protein
MIDHVVVDVEIKKTIEETPGGWDATDKLGIAVACVWQYRDQRMRVYGPDDYSALRTRLLQADRISGYNIFNFDFPVIWGKSKPEWLDAGIPAPDSLVSNLSTCAELKYRLYPKTDDLLRRIWVALGFNPDVYTKGMGGCKLDDIAGATLGVRKIGEGSLAPKWYQAGQIQRVVNYCADDAAIERDLTDFVDRYGYVIHNGQKLPIPSWRS